MRRLAVPALALAVLLGNVVGVLAGGNGIRGDLSCDGQVDTVDAALVLQVDVGLVPQGALSCAEQGDVNGDGRLTPIDAKLP